MSINVTYTEARANLASLWDEAASKREPIFIRRRGKETMVMVPADEFAGLLETAHLLRSPANAERLLGALERARGGEGEEMTLAELKAKVGL